LRGRRFGKSGSMRRQRSSSSNGLVMAGRLLSVRPPYQNRDQRTSPLFS
jgi:hypothetical protein